MISLVKIQNKTFSLPLFSDEGLTVRMMGCPPKGMGIVKWISGSDKERFTVENEVRAAAVLELIPAGSRTGM